MKSLIIGLLVISMLAGCASTAMVAKHTSARTVDGLMGYHVTGTYSEYGLPPDERWRTVETLDRYSKGICKYGYTKTDEQENLLVNQFGSPGISVMKNLVWEIKCNNAPS